MMGRDGSFSVTNILAMTYVMTGHHASGMTDIARYEAL